MPIFHIGGCIILTAMAKRLFHKIGESRTKNVTFKLTICTHNLTLKK